MVCKKNQERYKLQFWCDVKDTIRIWIRIHSNMLLRIGIKTNAERNTDVESDIP